MASGDETRIGTPQTANLEPHLGQPRTLGAGGVLGTAAFLPVNLFRSPLEKLIADDGVLEWPEPFFNFQKEGIRVLYKSDALLLADDMGLGKTIQAIAGVRILTCLKQCESVLLVVPAGLILQWRQAFRKWAPELRLSTVVGPQAERAWAWRSPVNVYLVSYETLRSDFSESSGSPPRSRVWPLVVLDEAQKIKNKESEISRVCKLLPRKRAWALTGTPLENRIEDLASICEFLTPWEEGQKPLRVGVGPELLVRHQALQLRRKKSQVLTELPPISVKDITLALAPNQRVSYDRAEKEGVFRLKKLGSEIKITHVLELIVRLKQICNFCPSSGESAKLEDIGSRLESLEAEGHKALIFSQYADENFGARAIAERLKRFNPKTYIGALNAEERNRVILAFQRSNEHTALILSLRAGGQGLNLQQASYVFHFDRWWNPAVERQAQDRAHRLGQKLPVTVYRYNCVGTIEERIDQILKSKQELFDEIVDDVSLDLKRNLTREELFGLFGL